MELCSPLSPLSSKLCPVAGPTPGPEEQQQGAQFALSSVAPGHLE